MEQVEQFNEDINDETNNELNQESIKNAKKEECLELKNIKYKTMLLNGNAMKETKPSNNLSNLEKFLEDEKNNNKNEPWCKLDKTLKTTKLLVFVQEYIKKNELSEEEEALMIQFLKDCLNRKKLQRVKDVLFDKTNGTIKDIPGLMYTKTTKHFTLKNVDKRVSTLKSLPPKKMHGTIKNKNLASVEKKEDSTDDDEV